MFKVSLVDGLLLTAADIAGETESLHMCTSMCWPQKGVGDGLKPFYQQKDQLSTDQGYLLWGTTVVIPDSLQSRSYPVVCFVAELIHGSSVQVFQSQDQVLAATCSYE